MTYIDAFLLGVLEGVTEFLPISSTGHMVLLSSYLGIESDPFVKSFEVIIQFGAILSVLIIYWRRFLTSWGFYQKLMLAFLPTAIIGFIAKNKVDELLESTTVVAWALILGGIVLIWSDRWKPKKQNIHIDQLSPRNALAIGFFQSISMIPGVSRSGATILGGMSLGLTKSQAAEFSFLLAVPTMAAATGYKLLKTFKNGGIHFDANQMFLLFIGSVTAFFIAWASIQTLLKIISKKGFTPFGWYRIILGALILFFGVHHG